MAAVASLPRGVVVGGGCAETLQNVDIFRAREATSAISCSSGRPGGRDPGYMLQEKIGRGVVMKVRRNFAGLHSFPSPLARGKLRERLLFVRVVNMASREDSNSETVANDNRPPKVDHSKTKDGSVLRNIIQQVEPLDISLISKDVSPDSTDAMKRTISGMLGLLPSDQFQVIIESPREPLARLLVSSMMTGYTLRNGEYRLCLKRSLENTEESSDERIERDMVENQMMEVACGVDLKKALARDINSFYPRKEGSYEVLETTEQVALPEEIGEVSSELANYIQQLQAKLATTSKELEECKHALSTLEMEMLAGEENNDLLGYLRSLEPEKVAELSQPTSPEVVEQVINEVIDGLLANLCLDGDPNLASFREGVNGISKTWDEKKVLNNVPLQFQSKRSNVIASRDYLARLLFWCMLLGHYMRAVEYRLELSRTLSLTGEVLLDMERSKQI